MSRANQHNKMAQKYKLILVLLLASCIAVWRIDTAHAASVSFSPSKLTIYEKKTHTQHTGQFTLRLTPDPLAEVNMRYETNDECELRLGGSGYTTSGQTVTTAEFQVFDVRAIDDAISDGSHSCIISYQITSSGDPQWQYVSATQTISVQDNNDQTETPHFVTALKSGSTVTEGGDDLVTYEVQISAAPQDPVTVYASAGSQCQLLVNGARADAASATIASGSNKAVIFTVLAREDDIFEGTHECVVNHSVQTNDLSFMGVVVPTFTVTVADNDQTYLQKKAAAEAKALEAQRAAEDAGLLDYFDSNNDGVADTEQGFVQSFINPVTGKRHAVIISGGADCVINGSVVVRDETTIAFDSSNLHFPLGIFEFSFGCADWAGASVNILLDAVYDSQQYGWLLRELGINGFLRTLQDAEIDTLQLQNGAVTQVRIPVSSLQRNTDTATIQTSIGLGSTLSNSDNNLLAREDTAEASGIGTFVQPLLLGSASIAAGSAVAWRLHLVQALLRRGWLRSKPMRPHIDRF